MFPNSGFLYCAQIWPPCFVPCPMPLFDPLYSIVVVSLSVVVVFLRVVVVSLSVVVVSLNVVVVSLSVVVVSLSVVVVSLSLHHQHSDSRSHSETPFISSL